MDLKKLLKTLKLHQEQLNIVIGVLILIVAGIFVFRYVKSLRNQMTSPTNNQVADSETYTIVKGDTLWSIAQKYLGNGNKWQVIADANKITSPSKIEIGQILTIPNNPVTPPVSPEPTPVASPKGQITKEAASTTSEIKEDTYTVVKGDNLWTIALRAYGDGTKWHQIAESNHLKNPRLIHPGNVFTIPR